MNIKEYGAWLYYVIKAFLFGCALWKYCNYAPLFNGRQLIFWILLVGTIWNAMVVLVYPIAMAPSAKKGKQNQEPKIGMPL